MLTRLILRNFQRHRKLVLTLGPVTTIIGPSDAGKTACLRALQWLATNKPSGVAFVRHGSNRTSVTLDVDGQVVKRTRGKLNTYHLEGRKLQAFGAAVPQPVADLLKLGPINFQGQHEAAFWFARSPAQISRDLNTIINLEAIDTSLSLAAAACRKAKLTAEIVEDRRAAAAEAAQQLAGVEGSRKTLRTAERSAVRLQTLRNELSALQSLLCIALEAWRCAQRPRLDSAAVLIAERKSKAVQRRRDRFARLQSTIAAAAAAADKRTRAAEALAVVRQRLSKFSTCPLCGSRRV